MGLQELETKHSIIDTVSADQLLSMPSECADVYRRYLTSHVTLGDLTAKWKSFVKRINAGDRALGVITAPIGYGKTSTAIELWDYCERNDILATPPFVCTSLKDMADATYGWIKYKLRMQNKSLLLLELDKIYQPSLAATIEELVDEQARLDNIPKESLRNALSKLISTNSLPLDISVKGLFTFLQGATDLVKMAGYKGLVVIPDEFKLFTDSSSDRDSNISRFKDLVWRIRSESKPLGFVVSMPEDTWAELNTRSADIAQRLGEDGIKVDLKSLYGKDFPSLLWEQLGKSLNLTEQEKLVILEDALESLGQFCADTKLSNGPRSVVAAFKRAIFLYQETGQRYTVFSLIEDYVGQLIAFDNKDSNTRMGLSILNSSPAVETDEERRVAKLLAAFPEGVPEAIIDHYGLSDAADRVVRATKGDLTITKVGGRPTLAVYKGIGESDRISEALKSLNRTFNQADLAVQRQCVIAFNQWILPRILPAKAGSRIMGWTGFTDVSGLIKLYPYADVELVGAPSDRYPDRRLLLRLTYDPKYLTVPENEKYQMYLTICLDTTAQLHSVIIQGNKIQMVFAVARPINEKELPKDITKLGDIFLPKDVSVLLLLCASSSLYEFMEDAQGVTEKDKAVVKQMVGTTFTERSIVELFSDELRSSNVLLQDLPLGMGFFNQLIARWCEIEFPEYHSIASTVTWRQNLEKYKTALEKTGDIGLSLAEKRGSEYIVRDKLDLASLFQYPEGSVSTLQNNLSTSLKDFVDIKSWDGKQAVIRLITHPLEKTILDLIRRSGNVHFIHGQNESAEFLDVIWAEVRSKGYLWDELKYAVSILTAREYISQVEIAGRVILHTTSKRFSANDLRERLAEIDQELAAVDKVSKLSEEDRTLLHKLAQIQISLNNSPVLSDEQLDKFNREILALEKESRFIQARMIAQSKENTLKLKTSLTALAEERLSNSIDRTRTQIQSTDFTVLLEELQILLEKEWKKTTDGAKGLAQECNNLLSKYDDWTTQKSHSLPEILVYMTNQLRTLTTGHKDLRRSRSATQQNANYFDTWVDLARRVSQFRKRLLLQGGHNETAKRLREIVDKEISFAAKGVLAEGRAGALVQGTAFLELLNQLENDWASLISDQRTAFLARQEEIVKQVHNAGYSRFHLDEVYNEASAEDSYGRLFSATSKNFEDLIKTGRGYIESLRVELLKAQQIYQLPLEKTATAKELTDTVLSIETEFNHLADLMKPEIVGDHGAFSDWLARLSSLISSDGTISTTQESVKRLVYVVRGAQLSTTEQKLLSRLSEDKGDLTETFVKLIANEEFGSIEDVLQQLASLYRKGRINLTYEKLVK